MSDWSRSALFQTLSELSEPQFERLLFILNPPSGDIPSSAASQGSRVSVLLRWVESLTGCGLDHLQEVFAQKILYPSLSNEELELVKSLSGIPTNDFEQLIKESQIPSHEIYWSSQLSQRIKAILFLGWARRERRPGIQFIRRTLKIIDKSKTPYAHNSLTQATSVIEDEWEVVNKVPNCVFIKFIRETISDDSVRSESMSVNLKSAREKQSSNLFLTIHFRVCKVNTPNGRFSFGIKKGNLKFKVEDGYFPMEDIGVTYKSFCPIALDPNSDLEEFSLIVEPGGTETEPEWEFKCSKKDIFLKKMINKKLLSKIIMTGKTFKIKANFSVNMADIHYSNKELFLFLHKISSRNINLLESIFFKIYLLPKFNLHLDGCESCLSSFEYEGF